LGARTIREEIDAMKVTPASHIVFAFRVFLPVLGSAFAEQDSRSSPSASITSASVMNFLHLFSHSGFDSSWS
jgi:hypothetical protein